MVPTTALALLPLASLPSIALAYVGPGAGLGVLGTIVGLLAAVVLALFGFLWYPLKRLLARRRQTRAGVGTDAGPAVTDAASAPVSSPDQTVRRQATELGQDSTVPADPTDEAIVSDRPAGRADTERAR